MESSFRLWTAKGRQCCVARIITALLCMLNAMLHSLCCLLSTTLADLARRAVCSACRVVNSPPVVDAAPSSSRRRFLDMIVMLLDYSWVDVLL